MREDLDVSLRMDQHLHHGGLMSAMRRAGNSIKQFRLDINGTVYSGEELADYFDRKKNEEATRTSDSNSGNHVDRRKAGMDAFKNQNFVGALGVFQPLAEETRLRKDWFNVFSAQIHLKDLRGALGALESMRSIPTSSSFENCLTPAEEQFHAARLFAEFEFGDQAARELIDLAECYQVLVDDTFLYIRRVPMFGDVLRIIDALMELMPENDFGDFLDSFSEKVGSEAQERIRKNQRS